MKKQLTSQLEKFNNKYNKMKGDAAIDNKAVEAQIAEEMKEKKSLYNVLGVLERSISLLTDEVRSLRHENNELKAVRMENADLKIQMNTIIRELTEIRKVTVGSLYMDDAKKVELGMNFYATPLHRHRAQQIKEKGFFEDPTPEVLEKMDNSIPVAVNIDEVVPVVKKKAVKTLGGKPGRRPARVFDALNLIASHTREVSGHMDWKKGGLPLVFAHLIVAEWKGVNVRNSNKVQLSADSRKAYQQVMLNKEFYGCKVWSDLIAKYEEAN
jgi:hypothetical protein